MKYITNTIDFYSDGPSAVTLGKFDGIHRGHQKLINEIKKEQSKGLQGVVFSIAPENIPFLLSPEEKRGMFEKMGMDMLVQCPFIPEVLHMDAEEFIAEILIRRLQAKVVVVGTDFRFGYQRKGDAQLLKSLQEKYHYEVRVIEKECYEDREISSTYVRAELDRGNIELVNNLLGYEFRMEGVVVHGKQLGRRIGMPTVNLVPDAAKLMPPCGVYYSLVESKGRLLHGVTNIGYKPTVDGTFLGAETYLYGISEDLYGSRIAVRLLHFRRPEMRFVSVDELKAQMEQDIKAGEEYFHGL